MVVEEIPEEKRPPIFSFLEQKYSNKLKGLKNRISLFNNIFSFLREKNLLPLYQNERPVKFDEFLSLEEK